MAPRRREVSQSGERRGPHHRIAKRPEISRRGGEAGGRGRGRGRRARLDGTCPGVPYPVSRRADAQPRERGGRRGRGGGARPPADAGGPRPPQVGTTPPRPASPRGPPPP